MDKILAAAQIIATARRNRAPLAALPPELAPATEAEGYRVQRAVHDILLPQAGSLAGYKIGCTSAVMQQYLDIPHPCGGGVFARGVHETGATLHFGDYVRVGVECEIAVQLARNLAPTEEPFTAEWVMEAIEAYYPAIEIVDDRYVEWETMGAPTLIADDFFAAGCVLGKAVSRTKAPDLLIQGNTIVGMDVEMGIRGDGIKVWYSQRTQIIDNYVERSRDLLVWYSNGTVIRDNTVRDGRYGFHFMNSDDGLAEHNRLFDNSVGIYLMYGKHFTIKDNLLQGSRGPSGHGLGIKEVDGVEVEGNIFYDNRIGVYIDNSPLSPDLYNHFTTNLIAFNDIGLGLLPSTTNNVFTQNSLVDNLEQVTVLGGGQLGENQWAVEGVGNFWSDYAGYDANGDGIGDLPFRSEQLSEHLMSSWPVLQLYRFSVAEAAVDFGARAVPLFRNEPKFIDPNPLVEPVIPVNAARPEYNTNQQTTRLWAIGLLAFAGLAMFWGWKGTRSVTNGERTASRRTHDASQPSPAREAALGNPEKLS